MITIEFLKNKFEVSDDKDLAEILGRSPGAISNWRKTGIPAAIERKAYKIMEERGITTKEAGKVAEPSPDYGTLDPLDQAFLTDWHKLTDVEKLRFWTMLKEAMEKKTERI